MLALVYVPGVTPELGRLTFTFTWPGVDVSIMVAEPLTICLLFGTLDVSSVSVTGVLAVPEQSWAIALLPEIANHSDIVRAENRIPYEHCF
jgi:hypothetical protein